MLVDAAGIVTLLSCGKQLFDASLAICVNSKSSHEMMSSRSDLHRLIADVDTNLLVLLKH